MTVLQNFLTDIIIFIVHSTPYFMSELIFHELCEYIRRIATYTNRIHFCNPLYMFQVQSRFNQTIDL